MNAQDWYLHFKLRAEILLPGVERAVIRSEGESEGDSNEIVQIDLGKSDDAGAKDLVLQFKAASQEEAWKKGNWWSEEVAALVPFLTSRRTHIEKLYITDRPAIWVPSKDYRVMIAPDAAATIATPPEVNPNDLRILVKARPERASRALRWLQKARQNAGTIDEFICLIVSLESLSGLVGPATYAYWQCAHCQQEVKTCPTCGETTRRKKPAADVLRDFTVETLGWTQKDWRSVWSLRNALLHGEQDVMEDEPYALLPKVESAVIAALKTVLDLPTSHAPMTTGLRGMMIGTEERHVQIRRDSLHLDISFRG